jgi:hypothetical protein
MPETQGSEPWAISLHPFGVDLVSDIKPDVKPPGLPQVRHSLRKDFPEQGLSLGFRHRLVNHPPGKLDLHQAAVQFVGHASVWVVWIAGGEIDGTDETQYPLQRCPVRLQNFRRWRLFEDVAALSVKEPLAEIGPLLDRFMGELLQSSLFRLLP